MPHSSIQQVMQTLHCDAVLLVQIEFFSCAYRAEHSCRNPRWRTVPALGKQCQHSRSQRAHGLLHSSRDAVLSENISDRSIALFWIINAFVVRTESRSDNKKERELKSC